MVAGGERFSANPRVTVSQMSRALEGRAESRSLRKLQRPAGAGGSAKTSKSCAPLRGAHLRIPLPGVRRYALTPGYDLDDPSGVAVRPILLVIRE
jgi:hypothetical protein